MERTAMLLIIKVGDFVEALIEVVVVQRIDAFPRRTPTALKKLSHHRVVSLCCPTSLRAVASL